MDIAIRAAARPGQRRLVCLCAVLAGVAAGLVIGLAARVPGGSRVVTVTPVRRSSDLRPAAASPTTPPPSPIRPRWPRSPQSSTACASSTARTAARPRSAPRSCSPRCSSPSVPPPAARWSPPRVPAMCSASSHGSSLARRPYGRSRRQHQLRAAGAAAGPGHRGRPLALPAGLAGSDPPDLAQPPSTTCSPIAAAVARFFGTRSPHPPCASWRPRAVRRFVARIAPRCAGPALTA